MPDTAKAEFSKIARDETFQRHYADHGLSYFMSRHMELVFLQSSPAVMQESETGSYRAKVESTVVSNVRLGVNGAIALAIDILEEVADEKRINRSKIVADLEVLLQRLRAGTSDDPEA